MKLVVLAALVQSASAFVAPSMTFAVGKAPAKKVAAPAKKAAPVPKAAPKVVAKAAPAKAAPKVVAKAAPKVVAKAAPKVVAKAAPKVVAKAAPKVVAKAAPKVVAKAAPAKKVVPKAAPKKVVAAAKPAPKKVVKAGASGTIPSAAIPYEDAPAILDGSLVGDVGFDPCFLATKAESVAAPYFNGLFVGKTNLDGVSWYREAELMHGRICMVAVLGFIAPGFGTISGNEATGIDAYSFPNPLEAAVKVPGGALLQIFLFMVFLEFRRINNIFEQGSSYQAGDSQRWGQGAGRWNPFNLNYTPAEYEEKQLQEIKHGRLAMIGLLGLIFQANASGVSVVDQWRAAFTIPEYAAKSGYYFPEGI